jgi:hypothetical protein
LSKPESTHQAGLFAASAEGAATESVAATLAAAANIINAFFIVISKSCCRRERGRRAKPATRFPAYDVVSRDVGIQWWFGSH